MNPWDSDPFGAATVSAVTADAYTPDYRVSGTIRTRFGRVADIVNQLTSTHLVVEQATISEFAGPTATLGAQQAMVALDELLFVIAALPEMESRPEMRIPKRAVRAQLALPPFRLTGMVHVPQGSRPVDGLVNNTDRFLPMTDVAISCAAHPELARNAPVIALQRSKAQLILVADDERAEELLADVLDESTAQGWLQRDQGTLG
jgi:hypothetical protein